jgi:hypothetical protein
MTGDSMSDEQRLFTAVVHVLHVDIRGGRMDCEDNDRNKVWVTASPWSYRRAYLTHAAPFMEAAEVSDPYALEGMSFMAKLPLTPPPEEHEGGERLEWPELSPAPSRAEVKASLGIDLGGPEGMVTDFSEYVASTALRSFFGGIGQADEETATQVVVNAGHAWYTVVGAEYDGNEVELKLSLDEPFYRPPLPVPADFVIQDDGSYPGGFPEHTMSFSDAAGFAQDWAARITREEWEDEGVNRVLHWDEDQGHMVVSVDGGKPEVWAPTQDEVLNIDWCIVLES